LKRFNGSTVKFNREPGNREPGTFRGVYMGLTDAVGADNAMLFDENGWAVDAVYTKKSDRSAKDIRVVLENAAARQLSSDLRPQGSPTRIISQMLVLKSEISEPAYQDTVRVDGTSWTVLKPLWEELGVLCIEVDREMRAKY
jgi:hypothetical protein